jgi:hypothetical protein
MCYPFKRLTKTSMKDLQIHQYALQSVAFPSLPHLEELKLTITVESEGDVAWPVIAGRIAAGYIVPAFGSIFSLRLGIGWKGSRNAKEDYPAGQVLLQRMRDAFAHLDGVLMDETLFRSLKEVEINFSPTFTWNSTMEDGEARDLQMRIRSKAVEMFHSTIERLHTFAVTAKSGVFV